MSIDYGRFPDGNAQLPNRNSETGIRYGIASQHDLADWVFEEMEPEYCYACPYCGADLTDGFEPPSDCPECGKVLEDEDCYGEDPIAHNLDSDGVKASMDGSGDLWVFLSPVITTGRHCSPCAPGAVSIGPTPAEDGIEAYGLPGEFWAVRETGETAEEGS